jgi:hypothetical protein
MTHEFTPQPPEIHTESRSDVPTVLRRDSLQKKLDVAKKRYSEAEATAERADDTAQTEIPFYMNAVLAAELLSIAAVRGADVS